MHVVTLTASAQQLHPLVQLHGFGPSVPAKCMSYEISYHPAAPAARPKDVRLCRTPQTL